MRVVGGWCVHADGRECVRVGANKDFLFFSFLTRACVRERHRVLGVAEKRNADLFCISFLTASCFFISFLTASY